MSTNHTTPLYNASSDYFTSTDAFYNDSSENTSSAIYTPGGDINNNSTSKYHFYGPSVVVPLALSMVFIIIFAVGGNIMVVLTIVRHRGMKTRTNMFICNLAIADILVAVLDMPVSLITILEGNWVFGDALCKLNGFTMALFLICSIHTLMYISVHKYISITRPFSRAMTPRRIKMMIFASWMWAAFCATGPLIGWNENIYKKGASQCGPKNPQGIVAVSHSLLITTSNYIIPLAVMSFCYWRIFKEIHSHMKRIRETSNIDLENSVEQQKKVATTLFLVLACFLLCWTPFVLYSNAVVMVKDKSKVPLILNPLAYWCGYFNSACNPIIYAFRSPSFRKGYKEIMCGAPSAKLSAERRYWWATNKTARRCSSISQQAQKFTRPRASVPAAQLSQELYRTVAKHLKIGNTVNSMSFRSRSGRGGSLKSGSNTNIQKAHQEVKPEVKRQKTLLSQTSWRSMPLIPNLVRSFSKHSTSSGTNSPRSQHSPSPTSEKTCGLCGFWKPSHAPHEDDYRVGSHHGEIEELKLQKQNRRRSSGKDAAEEDALREAVIVEESETEDTV
ncbi:hypothetical protein JTE90_024885 [Oedothorax gibbosus]|uniref:G-protein coupled receptors family 1 profile domain-containing protein n=1 Tax=Oedothorax gibbosus TaxID=931172 RepID=A0AAV6V2U5_9ARAC|nr:hypothetical protein JTE90_024885 [Oedothorax gibbosus]